MFKRWLNHGRLALRLSPRGPIMIKSGRDTVDPSQPDMAFVRTAHAVAGDTVYLPGTGLKGALRAHAERLLRGSGIWVCDPLARSLRREERAHAPLCRKAASSPMRSGPDDTATVFRLQCPACRTFGSLAASGRVSILDGYPWRRDADEPGMKREAALANRTERRMQVAIDRETGQAAQSGALYEIEVVTGGTFWTEVHFENVQLWQLALLLNVIADVDAGDVGIGFGKARGLGRFAARPTQLRFTSLLADKTRNKSDGIPSMFGAGALATADEATNYGLLDGDTLKLPSGTSVERSWRGRSILLDGEYLEALASDWDAILTHAVSHLDGLRRAG